MCFFFCLTHQLIRINRMLYIGENFINMATIATRPAELSPNVITFLPMIYVAWADAVLSPEEITTIRAKIEAQDWISQDEKAYLLQYLQPGHIPDAREMQQWVEWIRQEAAGFGPDTKRSLVALGQEIASLGNQTPTTLPCNSAEACRALTEIEEALGVIPHEASRDLLNRPATTPASVDFGVEATFDVEAMARILDRDHLQLREEVRALFNTPEFRLQLMTDKTAYREHILQWCQKLADRGWGALAFPEFAGGKADMSAYIAIFEMLGYHDLSLSIKFGVQFGLFGGSVFALGTEKHHRKYLPGIGSLDIPGCFAMTEENHGSNVRDIETLATYQPETGEFILHSPNPGARKTYIGNAAAHGQVATVFAQLYSQDTHYGVHAFVVRIRDQAGNLMPGVSIEDCGEKLGLNGVDNGRIWFDRVRVPLDDLLDRFATVAPDGTYSSPIPNPGRRFFTMLGTLVGGRVCVPMNGLSACKRGLALAIRYAFRRRQFGRDGESETRIIDYQTHQLRLLPALARSYALHFSHRYMADRFLAVTEDDAREIEALAAGLKAVSTWHTTATLQTCREACGGNGYLAENHFAALKADTDIYTTFEGDNIVLLQLVAKSRLSEFKQQFHDHKIFGLVNYMAKGAATTITELNPIVVRRTNREHLLDPEFHLAAFRFRENQSLGTAARRLKSRIDNGMDSYDAFIACQQHLVEMAKAYINRIILEQFQQAVRDCTDPATQHALQTLCNLYALHTLEEDKGYWLEAGYLEGVKSKAIRRLVLELCEEVKKDAPALVDAFKIPDQCLDVPMMSR